MERQVAALIELAAGRASEAIEILKAATDAELQLPPPLGLPAPIKPAPELLGEFLIELGRPAEAVDPFRRALERNANRSLSVLGLARAAAAAGSSDVAREHYRELLENYSQADADLPELAAARAALASAGSLPSFAALRHRRHRRPHRVRCCGICSSTTGLRGARRRERQRERVRLAGKRRRSRVA